MSWTCKKIGQKSREYWTAAAPNSMGFVSM